MDILYDVNAFSSDDEPRRPKNIRHRINHFEEWDAHDFFCRFRLSKRTVESIIEEIEETISYPTNRNDRLSPSTQLLLALRFCATGSFLQVAADFCGVHKSTASKTIKRVSDALAALRPLYIKMPYNEEELRECKQKFYNIARFPRCIGAIDCSHVKIQSPGGNEAEIFRNRKQFFSLNVQTIADTDLKIRDIVTRWPGSAHDSHIFRNLAIYNSFENKTFGDSLLIGDSGYPIKNYFLTPLLHTRNQAENLFNDSLIRTGNVVERSYGVWKSRFPSLALGLRLKLETTQAVVVATAVLHNIACSKNEQQPLVNEEEERAVQLVNNIGNVELDVNPGRMLNLTRQNIINNHFARL